MPRREPGVIIDVTSKRMLLMAGPGVTPARAAYLLDGLAAALRRAAPGNVFEVDPNTEAVVLGTPMHRDAMVAIFREAASACGLKLY